MEIKQFEDKNLAHYSYAIVSNGEIALIDPARNPQPYYDFANDKKAKIKAIIETHPHADFVSSHLEIHKSTNASIYVSKLLGAEYDHNSFDDGETIALGDVFLKAINTPGHSPDSISVLLTDGIGTEKIVFTGDTLFIGDCGRPDLRESAGAITAQRAELAKYMYKSLRDKLMTLPDNTIVYPAHGAGSLCGKGLSSDNSSTIGAEKLGNWSLQKMSEGAFVQELLADQPFIPKYFPFDVDLNKKGAENYLKSISGVKRMSNLEYASVVKILKPEVVVIDTRPQLQFKKKHLHNAFNLMNDNKFETWLGSIIKPEEPFYLTAENESALEQLIERIAKIGYENQIELAFVSDFGDLAMDVFDPQNLKNDSGNFTIIDIRNDSETKTKMIFENAIHIPLPELRDRTNEIPKGKPIVVHCAGGYRSAAGSSILKAKFKDSVQVYDLSEAVKQFY